MRTHLHGYVSHVLDRQLLNGRCHGHENYRVCSRTRSHDSVIFSYFLDSYFSSYGEFKMREIIKLSVMLPQQLAGRWVSPLN